MMRMKDVSVGDVVSRTPHDREGWFQVGEMSRMFNGKIQVTDASGEMIVDAIGVRMLRPSQMDDLASAREPVIYVPWSAKVSQVLDELNDEDRSVAVGVNEFGELLGAVTIDDVLRRVLAPGQEDVSGESLIQEIGADRYRVSGSASIRSLAKQLGLKTVSGEGVTTVAGFIQRHNERLPRLGDWAPLGRFTLSVIEQDEDSVWIEVTPGSDDTEETG